MLSSHGAVHHLADDFDQALEVEALARAHVQLQRDGIQLLLAMFRNVCAFGQILANQAVDVFVAATLPGAATSPPVGWSGTPRGPAAAAHRRRPAARRWTRRC